MNTSKLKSIFITACCFVVVLCSESKSMDTASDHQETASYKAKSINSEDCLGSLKTEISSNLSSVLLLPNQDENKRIEPSWTSYMVSPVKAVIQGTYNIFDFTVKHPTQAIITSLIIAAQLTTVAADCNIVLHNGCNCILWNGFENQKNLYPFGMFPNATACMSLAVGSNYKYYGCF